MMKLAESHKLSSTSTMDASGTDSMMAMTVQSRNQILSTVIVIVMTPRRFQQSTIKMIGQMLQFKLKELRILPTSQKFLIRYTASMISNHFMLRQSKLWSLNGAAMSCSASLECSSTTQMLKSAIVAHRSRNEHGLGEVSTFTVINLEKQSHVLNFCLNFIFDYYYNIIRFDNLLLQLLLL